MRRCYCTRRAKLYDTTQNRIRQQCTIYKTLVNKYRVEVPLPPPEELRKMIAEALPFWARIIRDNNIKIAS